VVALDPRFRGGDGPGLGLMERSFRHEVQSLHLGEGETFRGEGILAVTKALLQSGVSYVGGYQGAPGGGRTGELRRRHG
jgi:hypothetical protein